MDAVAPTTELLAAEGARVMIASRHPERAMARADPDALLGLDSLLADELLVAGRASWQVLAGAARNGGGADAWQGSVAYAAAPFGVSYLVAFWSRG